MSVFITLATIVLIYSVVWFLLSIYLKRNDIADIAWGLGFVIIAWSSFFLSEFATMKLITNCLITFWGLRLSFHIYKRAKNKPEDFRYLKWRNEWKHFYIRSYLQVFLLQGIFMYIIALSIIFINIGDSKELNWIVIIGFMVWLLGFLFEVIADRQLSKFKKLSTNKNKVIQTGLWKYSRHPNYFGEVVLWWGIFIISCSIENWFYTIVSPLLITYLILFLSGIPMLEEKYKHNTDFQLYKKRTSIFIPIPPKKI